MSLCEWLARGDRYLRPLACEFLSPALATRLYSSTRPRFQRALVRDIPVAVNVPEELGRTVWGIEFRSPILNAAGMFKNGEGYQLVAAQGAGAYLSGTTTGPKRQGNSKEGVYLPFAPYPHSEASSNWLGLPNDGDQVVAARLATMPRVMGCPVGASIMGSPNLEGEQRLEALVKGLFAYQQAGVDFIEMNESCPNTEQGRPQENELFQRLRYVQEHFLKQRQCNLPVLVKFSIDTDVAQISDLLAMLVELGFDGITLGNTSTRYKEYRDSIAAADRKLYDYFTSTFGGGLGGALLQPAALALVSAAQEALQSVRPEREFHIIRTGGVLAARDVLESLERGASLVQWYTGYYEAFAKYGHGLYESMYAELLQLR